jgi:hypothetical protein
MTCETHQVHHAIATASPGLYVAEAVGGFECTCSGCPKTVDEVRSKLENAIDLEIHENGLRLLVTIAHAAGLEYPTPEMRNLMEERNKEILLQLGAWAGSVERFQAIQAANSKYLARIEDAAHEGKRSQSGAGTGLRGSSEENMGDASHRSHLLLMVVVGLAVLVLVLAAVIPVTVMSTNSTKVITIDISLASQEPCGSPVKKVSALVMGQPVTVNIDPERVVVASPCDGTAVRSATEGVVVDNGASDLRSAAAEKLDGWQNSSSGELC